MSKINKDKIKDCIGGAVDFMFLLPPTIFKKIKPACRKTREDYEKEIMFYIDKGFVKKPGTFFHFPGKKTEYEIIQRGPCGDGEYQIISYKSKYEARNPFLRDELASYTGNSTGYLVRWTHGDRNRKTVICIHGYLLGDPKQAYRMFKVKKMFEMGLDVALFILPFHWNRRPDKLLERGIFLQPDNAAVTCECMGQAMYDLDYSLNILKKEGAGDIGLLGASLGAYIASLYICQRDRVSFAAMMVPAVNMSSPFGIETAKHIFKMDPDFKEKVLSVWEMHSPLNFKPKISKDRLLFIASRGDRLCPFKYVNALCEKWDWPRHYFHSGGHWLVFNNVRGRAWYGFLKDMGFIPPGK